MLATRTSINIRENKFIAYIDIPLNKNIDEKKTYISGGWSGGAMVLGKLSVPGRPTIRIILGQGLTALAVGAGGGCLDIFNSRLSLLFSFSLFLGDSPI